jgi:hypothetical protein
LRVILALAALSQHHDPIAVAQSTFSIHVHTTDAPDDQARYRPDENQLGLGLDPRLADAIGSEDFFFDFNGLNWRSR